LQRLEGQLTVIEEMNYWTSPRLGIQFVWSEESLEIYYPNGKKFLTSVEFAKQLEQTATGRPFG